MNPSVQLVSRRRMLTVALGQLDAARRAPRRDNTLIARLETQIADHRRTIADLERAIARSTSR